MSRRPTQTAAALLAFAAANARYWTAVAPRVRRELVRWEAEADAIPDRRRRALALGKLREERFNVELAATLATLAPRTHRGAAVDAIVAAQVAYDYHDALNERALSFDDDRHLARLARAARETLAGLPAAPAIEPVMQEAIARCAQAQALAHAGAEEEIERWAAERARGTGLGWPELLAGAQASVLCAHALIAAAADPRTTRAQARALDALYLRIGALTMLDSLIDGEQDRAAGERGYLRRYGGAQRMAARLATVAGEAARLARGSPHGAHHLMTMAGVFACYGSAPAAGSDPQTHLVFAAVRRELGPALTAPALALMRVWRVYKRVTLSSAGVTQPHPWTRLRAHGVR